MKSVQMFRYTYYDEGPDGRSMCAASEYPIDVSTEEGLDALCARLRVVLGRTYAIPENEPHDTPANWIRLDVQFSE